MTMVLMLGVGLATGAMTMLAWQRLHAWRNARKLEWDPY